MPLLHALLHREKLSHRVGTGQPATSLLSEVIAVLIWRRIFLTESSSQMDEIRGQLSFYLVILMVLGFLFIFLPIEMPQEKVLW